MKQLSNKIKPKLLKNRYSSGGSGYRHDNAEVAFTNPGRVKKEKEEKN